MPTKNWDRHVLAVEQVAGCRAFARLLDQIVALSNPPSRDGVLDAGAGLPNSQTVVASAVSLPLADFTVDLAVSNYCFHHLRDRDKARALREWSASCAPAAGSCAPT